MEVLFETILETIPAPVDNRDEPLQMQTAILDYNDYVGRIGIGRIFRGTMRVGDSVAIKKLDGRVKQFRITKLFGFMGLQRVEIERGVCWGYCRIVWHGRYQCGRNGLPWSIISIHCPLFASMNRP